MENCAAHHIVAIVFRVQLLQQHFVRQKVNMAKTKIHHQPDSHHHFLIIFYL